VIATLINLIIVLLVAGILLWLLYWLIDAIPIPDPPARFIRLAVVVIAVLVIVLVLLDFAGISRLPRVGT
jgi:hypothetical protein